MSKIMLIYPPGRNFQRGEERCQIDIESSVANTNRPCNDLGYMSSCLKRQGYETFLKDYQSEKLNIENLLTDLKNENPDIIFISITNGSIFEDLKVVDTLKNLKKDLVIILKGAIFFNPNKQIFSQLNLENVDYLIGGEAEFIIEKLVNAHFKNKELLKEIEGISYKIDNEWITQHQTTFCDDLDSLPFPDRNAINNKLYINPETNRPMALVMTSKGCNFNCCYCLSPIISGKKARYRSAESIFNEIQECIEKYGIVDFFFKSDTFTVNRARILDLCNLIIKSGINKKINWVSTARVDTLDEELIITMKKAGCSLLSVGFESGSNESLKKMKKNTTIEKNLEIAKLCKKHKIEIFGHFLIGFPWEDISHLKATKKHIFDIDANYIEISVVVPYFKTPIFEEYCVEEGKEIDILGFDSYNHLFKSLSKLSPEFIKNFKKQILFKYYSRPKYIFRKLMAIKSIPVLKNYFQYGLRLLKNLLH